jgi:hypothetical protein
MGIRAPRVGYSFRHIYVAIHFLAWVYLIWQFGWCDVELDDSLMVALLWVGPQLKTFW